jgi:hypothetical protein
MPKDVAHSIYDQREVRTKAAKKRLKILIIIGVLFLVLFLIVLIAALRSGGLSNLTKGDNNALTNTLTNIGTSFVDPKDEEKKPAPLAFPSVTTDKTEVTKNQLQNFIAFDTFDSGYEITIKKDTFVYFTNRMETPIGLKFSDSRVVKLNSFEEQNVMFTKAGDFTFTDVLDKTGEPIKGVIHVLAN